MIDVAAAERACAPTGGLHERRPREIMRAPTISSITGATFVICLATVLLLEVWARIFLPQEIGAWRAAALGGHRVVFISPGAFQNRVGYSNYRPNAEVREIAFYPDTAGALTPEYDCTYRSDRLGFLSNIVDYNNAEILVLGDSITQGQGGCEWQGGLDPTVRSKLYFAAVMGHGVMHWKNIVAHLETQKKLQKILIVFITDDFFRTPWIFGEGELACLEGRSSCLGSYWYPIGGDMKSIAAERYAERNVQSGQATLKVRLKYYFITTYHLYKILTGKTATTPWVFHQPVQAVHSLARKYIVSMIWVNETSDMDLTSARSLALATELKDLNVARCRIPAKGFLPRDGHPNASGLQVLKGCIENSSILR